MSECKIVAFDFQGHQVRVHKTEAGKELWVAKDVCEVLELPNVSQALARLDVDEIANITTNDVEGRPHKFKAINEPGFWKLVLTSRSEKAKEVTRWFTHEVLPQIRQTGYYVQKGDEERVRDALDKILLDRAMSWESLWDSELPRLLSKIANWKQVEKPKVPGMICLDIYNRILGKRVVDEARNRRDARGVKTIHQLFQEPIRRLVRDKIEAVMAIARISTSYEDFQNKLCT
jgi:prophage antirepressor-like protein